MKVDSAHNTLTYRRSEAVKVAIVDGCLDIKWPEDWKNWTAFQDSIELRDLIQRVSTMLTRADAGKGHGKGSGASAAEDPLQRRDPWSSVAPKPAERPHSREYGGTLAFHPYPSQMRSRMCMEVHM